MKKANVLIFIVILIIFIITIIQILNISLTTGISGFPEGITLADVQKGQIITVISNNSIILIIISFIIMFINRFSRK